MLAYKYSSNSNYNPYIQASVKPQMGKHYVYNGRLYCQVKKEGKISYADSTYSLAIRLVSWSVDSIDVELELKSFMMVDNYNLTTSECNNLIDDVSLLSNLPLYIRINKKGHIQKVFNINDIAIAYSLNPINESQVVGKLEANPILSAFVAGQIESGKTEKTSQSSLIPSLNVTSELKVDTRNVKFNNTKETTINNTKIRYDEAKLNVAEYEFNTSIDSNRGIDRVLAFSITYSIEEKVNADESAFVSVGLEKVVLEKDISLTTKLYSALLKNVSAFF